MKAVLPTPDALLAPHRAWMNELESATNDLIQQLRAKTVEESGIGRFVTATRGISLEEIHIRDRGGDDARVNPRALRDQAVAAAELLRATQSVPLTVGDSTRTYELPVIGNDVGKLAAADSLGAVLAALRDFESSIAENCSRVTATRASRHQTLDDASQHPVFGPMLEVWIEMLESEVQSEGEAKFQYTVAAKAIFAAMHSIARVKQIEFIPRLAAARAVADWLAEREKEYGDVSPLVMHYYGPKPEAAAAPEGSSDDEVA